MKNTQAKSTPKTESSIGDKVAASGAETKTDSTAGDEAAATRMSLKECMSYAVSNSTKMRIRQAATDDAQINRREAILRTFLPSISANSDAYYSFGRSIDPKTNTYINETSFHNNYGINAGITLFDGFNAVNNMKIAKTSLMMGKTLEEQAEADICLAVMEAFCNAVYYAELKDIQEEQVAVAKWSCEKARLQEELGQIGHADVVQMMANLADSEYDLVMAQNSYIEHLSKLKDLMFWPVDQPLALDTSLCDEAGQYGAGIQAGESWAMSQGSEAGISNLASTSGQGDQYGAGSQAGESWAMSQGSEAGISNLASTSGQGDQYGTSSQAGESWAMSQGSQAGAKGFGSYPARMEVIGYAKFRDPSVIVAHGKVLNAERELSTAKWSLLPSIGLYGGWSTSYYHYLGAAPGTTTPFPTQFKTNGGEYVQLSLSIPIFSAASRQHNIARKRNALVSATAEYEQKVHEIESEVTRAYNDLDGAINAYTQACRKAELQEEAFRLNTRKMEQGLISPIEQKTSSNSYLRAVADRLGMRLQMLIKGSIVRYYHGEDYIGQF